LAALPELAQLNSDQLDHLAREIEHEAAFFPLMREAQSKAKHTKVGHRRTHEWPVLIRACGSALEKALGAPQEIRSGATGSPESLAVTVARIAAGAARNQARPYSGDLSRQIKNI